jgi:hypothetical protein
VKSALVAALLLLAAGTAAAHPPPIPSKRVVAILDVNVAGIPPEAKAQFEERLDQQLDTSRFWIASAKSTHEHLANSTSWTDGCVVGACLSEVKAQAGAELALLATLTGSGTSFGYVVTLVRTDTGNVLSQKAARCDVCTVTDAIQGASDAVRALLADVPATLPDPVGASIATIAAIEKQRVAAVEHVSRTHAAGRDLAIGGALAAIAGAVWFAADHHAAGGALVGGLGGGAAAGGVVVLTF